MFNISSTEILIVLLLALIVLGPQKLPELARSIGRGMREFRKMQDEVKDMVKVDLNPEPPSVHQPGVSGPKRTTPRPHRTPRPAGATSDEGALTPEPTPSDAEAPSETSGTAWPDVEAAAPSDDERPDGPPAAAGAG